MKRINLFWIIWIFVTLEFKGYACVSYPGVYRNEPPVIIPEASPIENVFVTERYGINYECIETCYPILNICDDKCSNMPDLPECLQCQRLQAAQPTPIIIETPPYEPRPPSYERPMQPVVSYSSRVPRPPTIPKPIVPNVHRPVLPQPPRPEIPRPPKFEMFEPVTPPTFILPDVPQPPKLEIIEPDLPPQPIIASVPTPPVLDLLEPESPPEIDDFDTELPPHTTMPDISLSPIFEYFQPVLPAKPILPVVPRPPQFSHVLPEVLRPPQFAQEFGMFEPVTPPTFVLPDVPISPLFEPELPPQPILPVVPRPPQFSHVLPTQPILPETVLPPKLEPFFISQPMLPEVLRPPIFETDLLPQPIMPETQIYPQFELFEHRNPPTMLPHVPLPPRFEQFEPMPPPKPLFVDFPQYPMIDIFEDEVPQLTMSQVPSLTIYEPPQVPVIQPIFPEIVNPGFVQIPNLVSPEILVPQYPENVLHPETVLFIPEVPRLVPPIVNEYQDICNDYCLLKRNISECEICLKTGVPAEYLEHCSNCLVNPSEPECELCYPILMNLCREFCIFEENEPDCSICYSQPIIELPVALTQEFINHPAPILHTTMELIPAMTQEICPEYCAFAPSLPECDGCFMGVEVLEKVCVDICSGYCLENPGDEQCAVCFPTVLPDVVEINGVTAEEFPTLEIINYQCCYGDYCTPMPRNGVCPVVCKELCTTACSNDCFNPTCPDCQEVVALNELRRTQFMIWLKTKLSDMKSRYMTMIEACIRRTELMYERELQAIEMEVDTSFLLA